MYYNIGNVYHMPSSLHSIFFFFCFLFILHCVSVHPRTVNGFSRLSSLCVSDCFEFILAYYVHYHYQIGGLSFDKILYME